MKTMDALEIIQCLPEGRTLFHYFRDRYALFLLGKACGAGKSVGELKGSRFGRLLQKTIARELTATVANGVLTRETCEARWPSVPETYLLTLGTWGREKDWRSHQVSRPGINLVLQLNFTAEYNRLYREALGSDDYELLGCKFHPVAREGFLTMAWARLDIDLARGEVLIEEIQNDWLRDARRLQRRLALMKTDERRQAFVEAYFGPSQKLRHVEGYLSHLLTVQSPIWDEAMLTATLDFVSRELGIKKVFYHSHETGMRLKGIEADWGPPRSIYTDLPRRFCFSLGEERPTFFEGLKCNRSKAVLRDPAARWFNLELN